MVNATMDPVAIASERPTCGTRTEVLHPANPIAALPQDRPDLESCAPKEPPIDSKEINPSRFTASRFPKLSAEDLHAWLLKAHRVGRRCHLKFCELLQVLDEGQLYLALGFSSVHQYAERNFGFQRSETYELLRVAAAMQQLPSCLAAYANGALSWAALKLIARVASADTESEWLAYAKDHSFAELRAEVHDALRARRDRPRADSFGLPNVQLKMSFELTLEEHERVRSALERVALELGGSLGSETVEPRDALLYLTQRFLENANAGSASRQESPFQILYQQCPDCRKARAMTADGPVVVGHEVVERVACIARIDVITLEEEIACAPTFAGRPEAGSAEAADRPIDRAIDRANGARLARRVRLRDGGRCANPGCGYSGPLHAHHIVPRALGGRTALWNEVAVCTTCHSLIHAGLLAVSGDPTDGLAGIAWRPRLAAIDFDSLLAGEMHEMREPFATRVVSAIADTRGRVPSGTASLPSTDELSAIADDSTLEPSAVDLAVLSAALVRLGWAKREAESKLLRAQAQLAARGVPATEEALLTAALSRT